MLYEQQDFLTIETRFHSLSVADVVVFFGNSYIPSRACFCLFIDVRLAVGNTYNLDNIKPARTVLQDTPQRMLIRAVQGDYVEYLVYAVTYARCL